MTEPPDSNEATELPVADPAAELPAPDEAPERISLAVRLAVLVAIVVLFLIIVALQPSTFRVARSTKIAATPAAVFEHVNDFRKWRLGRVSLYPVRLE